MQSHTADFLLENRVDQLRNVGAGFHGRGALGVDITDHRAAGFRHAGVRLIGDIGGHALVGDKAGTLTDEHADQLTACDIPDGISRAYPAVPDKGNGTYLDARGFEAVFYGGHAVHGISHAGGYGVQITATAPSLHMIRANIETKINPVVGTRQQSEDLVNYLMQEAEQNPDGLFSTNLFGRSLWEHVSDGISEKLDNMPPEAREKMGQTLARIINEGSGGLVCIIL